MLVGKTLLDYTNFFLRMAIKIMTKLYICFLKTNVVEEASLELRLRKIDETRN